MKAHFIVTTVQGIMVAICGAAFKPSEISGSRVGIYGQVCKECDDKVKEAWVTVK